MEQHLMLRSKSEGKPMLNRKRSSVLMNQHSFDALETSSSTQQTNENQPTQTIPTTLLPYSSSLSNNISTSHITSSLGQFKHNAVERYGNTTTKRLHKHQSQPQAKVEPVNYDHIFDDQIGLKFNNAEIGNDFNVNLNYNYHQLGQESYELTEDNILGNGTNRFNLGGKYGRENDQNHQMQIPRFVRQRKDRRRSAIEAPMAPLFPADEEVKVITSKDDSVSNFNYNHYSNDKYEPLSLDYTATTALNQVNGVNGTVGTMNVNGINGLNGWSYPSYGDQQVEKGFDLYGYGVGFGNSYYNNKYTATANHSNYQPGNVNGHHTNVGQGQNYPTNPSYTANTLNSETQQHHFSNKLQMNQIALGKYGFDQMKHRQSNSYSDCVHDGTDSIAPELAYMNEVKYNSDQDEYDDDDDEDIKKGAWTDAEDAMLKQFSDLAASKNWTEIADRIPGRTAKQCRERWCYNLDPCIKKEDWSPLEDTILLERQLVVGNKWALIANDLPGRTENAVKTRFKSILRAKKKEWRRDEDEQIFAAYEELGPNWKKISLCMQNRSKHAVKTRFKQFLDGLDQMPAVEFGKSNQTVRESIYPAKDLAAISRKYQQRALVLQSHNKKRGDEPEDEEYLNALELFIH